jgi:hypothetical protein
VNIGPRSHQTAEMVALTRAFDRVMESQHALEASPAYQQEQREYEERVAKLMARPLKRRQSW